MSSENNSEFSVLRIAEAFGVRLHRMLCDEKQQQRWLAYSLQQADPDQRRGVVERELFELILMPGLGSDVEKLAFTEILSDDFGGSGGLVDMVIDHRFGFAWIFTYEARVSLRSISLEQRLSAGRMATLLIAIVALGARARNAGYCISCPKADALYVGTSGAISVSEASGFHPAAEDRAECCAQGFDPMATLNLLTEVGEPDAFHLIHDVIHSLRMTSQEENTLEVCIHLLQEVLIPQRIHLPAHVTQPHSSIELQIVPSSPSTISGDNGVENYFTRKLQQIAKRFPKTLKNRNGELSN